MANISNEVIQACHEKLIQTKEELLNQMLALRSEHQSRDRGGDEVDQSADILAENQFLISQTRMREQIMEIELALSRIAEGNFGICEETDEPIEERRLLAIPWTRLSLEGAEIKEALLRRYSRA